jgi:chorismate mutase
LKRISTSRKKADEIDDKILYLLKERVEVCRRILAIKQEYGLPLRDSKRESEVYSHAMKKASEFGLNQNEIKAIYKMIIAMCVHAEKLSDKKAHSCL